MFGTKLISISRCLHLAWSLERAASYVQNVRIIFIDAHTAKLSLNIHHKHIWLITQQKPKVHFAFFLLWLFDFICTKTTQQASFWKSKQILSFAFQLMAFSMGQCKGYDYKSHLQTSEFIDFTQKGTIGFAEKSKANSLQTWFTLEVGTGTQFAIFGITFTGIAVLLWERSIEWSDYVYQALKQCWYCKWVRPGLVHLKLIDLEEKEK